MQKGLRKIGFFLFGVVVFVLLTYQMIPQVVAAPPAPPAQPSGATSAALAQLPPLPYDYAALEPYIDAQTMRLHHDKHHAGYVKSLNEALQAYPELQKRSVESLAQNLKSLPEKIRTKVRNNGGGHLNHTMYWQIMAPKAGGAPTGTLAAAIDKTFGNFEKFKQEFNKAGMDRFGSGWVWLIRDRQGKLSIVSTGNQDNPIMVDPTIYPIMGNDVWEHAYYLKHQNRRAEYLKDWWNVVNWKEVGRRYEQAVASQR